MTLSILAALVLQTSGATAPDVQRPNPRSMSKSEIAAFNTKVGSRHPYYIRCRKVADTGSNVRKIRTCKTQEEWKLAANEGNQQSRDFIESLSSKGGNSGN